MEDVRSIRFARTVQDLRAAARSAGWSLPTFRSPPGKPGAVRTIRRRPDGSHVVAVVLHGRAWDDVVADLVDGVIATNSLQGTEAARCRRLLVHACAPVATVAAAA